MKDDCLPEDDDIDRRFFRAAQRGERIEPDSVQPVDRSELPEQSGDSRNRKQEPTTLQR